MDMLCVGKECPFSGVTKSGRVWRKVPESDSRSVGHQIRHPPRLAMSKAEWNRVASCPKTSIYHSWVRVLSPLVLSNEALVLLKTAFPTSCEWLVLAEVYIYLRQDKPYLRQLSSKEQRPHLTELKER